MAKSIAAIVSIACTIALFLLSPSPANSEIIGHYFYYAYESNNWANPIGITSTSAWEGNFSASDVLQPTWQVDSASVHILFDGIYTDQYFNIQVGTDTFTNNDPNNREPFTTQKIGQLDLPDGRPTGCCQ